MAAGRVSMAGPFRRKWGQASLPCLYTFSKFCVKPSWGEEGPEGTVQRVVDPSLTSRVTAKTITTDFHVVHLGC